MGSTRFPWILSGLLHAAAAGFVLGLASLEAPAPGPVTIRLSAGPTARSAASEARGVWWSDPSPGTAAQSETAAPDWTGRGEAAPASGLAVPAAARLDELLGPEAAPATPETDAPAEAVGSGPGWTASSGEGYRPPPLPPPSLVPPGGARWTLDLSIAAGGGPAVGFQGLESGHPDLDSWLEEYLRGVSFPASLDGRDYRLRWVLRLEAGRPR